MSLFDDLSFSKIGEILTYNPSEPMLFSSGLFFFLFCFFAVFYIALRKHTLARIVYVTLFSLYFYYKSSGLWFGLLVFTATSDFLIARIMELMDTRWKKKLLVTLSLCINLGMLSYFKYTNFLIDIGNAFLREVSILFSYEPWMALESVHYDIFLPVGISFFTFQAMGYLMDVYRGKSRAEDNFFRHLVFLFFFDMDFVFYLVSS